MAPQPREPGRLETGGAAADHEDALALGRRRALGRAEPALARISLGADECTTGGGVGDEIRLEDPAESAAGTRPLVRFRPAPGLRCDG